MSQHDMIIADASGTEVLADMSAAFQALASHNLGTTAPTTKYQGMTWIDTNASPWTLKRWDGADWIAEGILDLTAKVYIPLAGNYPISQDHFKNRLKNGDMFIDQPKTTHASGAAMNIVPATGRMHACDLWIARALGATIVGQQIAGASGFRNFYRFTGAAGCTGAVFSQRIPSYDIADLASLPAMLSARMLSSGSLSVTWKAYYANALNNFTSRTEFATGTFATGATIAEFSAAISMHANAANGVEIEFSVGAFASGTWSITGVQLERGSQMTMFEMLPPVAALLECQRYYVVIDETCAIHLIGNYTLLPIPFPTVMRVTPTMANIAAGAVSNITITSEAAVSARGCSFGGTATASDGYITGRVAAYYDPVYAQ